MDPVSIDDDAIEERFIRASGPGGQHVNKVATAVELRFDIRRSSLAPDVQARLIALAGSRVITGDILVIESREHRSQVQNREAARARLLALLRRAATRPRTRRPTKPRPAAKERRLASKKQRGSLKEQRGRGRGQDDE